jgi:hypothetical protein
VEILEGLAEGAQVLAGNVSAASEGKAWKPATAQKSSGARTGAGGASAAPASAAASR